MSEVTRGEVFDNISKEREGYICFIATAHSKLKVRRGKKLVKTWLEIEKFYPRYEPSTVKKLYVEANKGGFKNPLEAKEGSFMTCLINPYCSKSGPFKYLNKLTDVFGMKCFIGSVNTQHGVYTVLIESF